MIVINCPRHHVNLTSCVVGMWSQEFHVNLWWIPRKLPSWNSWNFIFFFFIFSFSFFLSLFLNLPAGPAPTMTILASLLVKGFGLLESCLGCEVALILRKRLKKKEGACVKKSRKLATSESCGGAGAWSWRGEAWRSIFGGAAAASSLWKKRKKKKKSWRQPKKYTMKKSVLFHLSRPGAMAT